MLHRVERDGQHLVLVGSSEGRIARQDERFGMEALESANLAVRFLLGAAGRPHLAWGFAVEQ